MRKSIQFDTQIKAASTCVDENDAREVCLRCHQEHHSLKPLWRLPRYVFTLQFGSDVREETYGRYCPRCRRTMNVSVTAMGVMIVMSLLAAILMWYLEKIETNGSPLRL